MENLFESRNDFPISPLVRSEETDETDEHKWSKDVEERLVAIEHNSAQQVEISKKQYLALIELQKWFKIPVIVLAGINAIFSVGLNQYASQNAVSLINCILSFICGTIGSVELYLNITKKIEIALNSYQSFYLLSIKINNTLKLDRDHRNEMDGQKFLGDCLNEYEKLFQSNNVSPDEYNDTLIEIKIRK